MDTKPFWQSKMFWLNLLGALLLGSDWAIGHQAVLGMLGFSPDVVAAILMVANIIRRFSSAQAPLSLTDER